MTPHHFAWQAWHLATPTVVSRHLATSRFVLRGRRDTYDTAAHYIFCFIFDMTFFTYFFHAQHCHTPSFTHHLCHTPSFTHTHIFVTHHLSHTTLAHTTLHKHPCNSSIIHHLLCLSCLPCPAGTLRFCLLEEVDLSGYPVLEFFFTGILK